MTMTFFNSYFRKSKDICCGATLRGEKHVIQNKPNQDAVLIKYTKYGVILAVADGVGSLEKSQYASKAIVKATAKAFCLFEKEKINRRDITKTITKLYGKAVRKKYRLSAATTCIFAVISNSHGMFLGQVGDGSCYVNLNDNRFILKKKTDEFLNTADAISPLDNNVRWTTKHFKISGNDSIKIMLATDGISETVIPGMENDCLEYYLNDVATKVKYDRNKTIKGHLKNWNVKASTDDKTMIIFSRG